MLHNNKQDTSSLGQAELVDFPDQKISSVPARIDTGARTSSVWASNIRLEGDVLIFSLFGEGSDFYTGNEIRVTEFDETVVASSNGKAEVRFKVALPLRLSGRRIKASFTLADRSTQVYPVLIGRSTLRGKFVVDVKAGTVLKRQEKARTAELKKLLDKQEGGK